MSEQKTAKVTEVGTIKPWNNPKGGQIFFHQIVLDNGDQGEIGKKAEGAIKIGDEITYTIEASQYGNKIKAVSNFVGNGFQGGFKGGRGSNASFALSYSKDLMCAMVAAGKTNDLKAAEIADATVIVAVKFKTWLTENE